MNARIFVKLGLAAGLLLGAVLFTAQPASAAQFVFPTGGEYLRGTVTVTWVRELPNSIVELRLWASGTRLDPELCRPCPGTSFQLDTTRFSDGRAYVLEIIEVVPFFGFERDTTDGAFTIDNTPPETTAVLSGSAGDAGFYVGDVTVALVPTDETAGVEQTKVSVDGGALTTYGGSFRVTGDGAHSVRFFSVDRAGNTEVARTANFSIDATDPVSSISIGQPRVEAERVVYVTSATPISLSAADATSGVARIEYRLNEDAFVAYTGPFTVQGEDGEYRLEWRSVDASGNIEHAQFKRLHLDNTAPELEIRRPQPGGLYLDDTVVAETHPLLLEALFATLGADGVSFDAVPVSVAAGRLTVRAQTEDAAAGVADVRFYVDGELRSTDAEAPYEWTWDTSGEVAGEHVLTVESRDRLGNLVSASQRVEVVPTSPDGVMATVDNGGPNLPTWPEVPPPPAARLEPLPLA